MELLANVRRCNECGEEKLFRCGICHFQACMHCDGEFFEAVFMTTNICIGCYIDVTDPDADYLELNTV
jgi:hypothetical protein